MGKIQPQNLSDSLRIKWPSNTSKEQDLDNPGWLLLWSYLPDPSEPLLCKQETTESAFYIQISPAFPRGKQLCKTGQSDFSEGYIL